MTWLDKILNFVSDFLVTLQKLTGVWIWMVTEDVRQKELEVILPMQEITDEGTLKALHRIGFKNRVFVEKKTTGLSFVGNNCFICEHPWKVKVNIEDVGEAYLCSEHLNYLEKKLEKPLKIIRQRQTSNLASYRS